MFSNVLTGKLSDFSGVLVFGLLFNFFSDKNRRLNALFVVVLFTFWKSPLSESLIFAWNDLHIFPVARIVDYSDLLAFVMLPLVTHLPFSDKVKFSRPVYSNFILGITLFALCSTSRYRADHMDYWGETEIVNVVSLDSKLSTEKFISKLKSFQDLSLEKQDTLWINGGQYESYHFVKDSSALDKHVIDSFVITINEKNARKIHVQIISLELKEGADALELSRMGLLKKIFKVSNVESEQMQVHFGTIED